MAIKACAGGHAHEVIQQTKMMSCGPTCLQMAHHRVKGFIYPEKLAFSVTGLVHLPLSADYIGTTATDVTMLATVAKGIGVKATYKSCSKVAELITVFGYIGISDVCVLAHVWWAGGGGHFVLVDKSTVDLGTLQQTICVCDPGDGEVRRVAFSPYQTQGTLAYTAGLATGTFTGHVITFQK